VQRRTFDANGAIVNSLGDFPDAVRQTAREEKCALIDLHAMSKRFYEALGPERSVRAFAPGDNTHHNDYGAYELARCVVESIRAQNLPLARFLSPDVVPFDPSKPDPVDTFQLPVSASGHNVRGRSTTPPGLVVRCGIGDGMREVDNPITGKHEVVHTHEPLFGDIHTHTSRAGAELNARIVAAQVRRLLEKIEVATCPVCVPSFCSAPAW
jgi:hypothetical protein